MTEVPEDFLALYPKLATEPDERPVYYLWVFDPQEAKVHLEHNEGRHHAEHLSHRDLAARTAHPSRVHGYAYSIRGGWRVTDWEHHPVEDPFVLKQVKKALGQL